MIRRILWLLPVVFLSTLLLPGAAQAASIFEGISTPPILQVNPSVRWRALGDAGSAGFWDPTHAWANPALVGSAEGIQYERGTMDHDLIDFETSRTTLGWGGIGLSTVGRPFSGLGKIEMGFGELFTESVRSWSLGLSTSRLAATIARIRGNDAPAFTRWFDLEAGYSEKEAKDAFDFVNPPEEFVVTTHDVGFLVRAGAPVGPARIDLAWGSAWINTGGRSDLGRPATDSRNGAGVRASWDPAVMRSRIPKALAPGTSPIVSLAWAMDFVHREVSGESLKGWGAELGLANVLFGRIGREEQAHSWGLGAGVPLGRFAAVRWDHSYRTRFFGLPDERRDAWTVWMDPLAISRALIR